MTLPELDRSMVHIGFPMFLADFEDLLVTVAYILEKNPKAEFWTTYQERRYAVHILQLVF